MQNREIRAETFFLVFGVIFGVIICLLTPYGGGYDELTITARFWELSHFKFVPNSTDGGIKMPTAFFASSYRSRYFISPFTLEEMKLKFGIRIEPGNMSQPTTRSAYFPVFYLPSTLFIGFFTRFLSNIPVLVSLYLLKFFNLFVYLVLVYISIKLIPFGKLVLAVLALTPMVIFQTISVSYYYLHYGVILLFISFILFLSEKHENINHKEYGLLLFLVFLIISAKPDSLVLILLLFLLPYKRIISKKRLAFLFLFTAVCILLFVVGWNLLIYQDYPMKTEEVNVFKQIAFIIQNPFSYLGIVFRDLQINGVRYIKNWIGDYGYTGLVPNIVYPLFLGLIFLVSIFDKGPNIKDIKIRLILLVFSFINALLTYTILYLIMSKVGANEVVGIFGKFFFTSGVLFFLSITGLIRKPFKFIHLFAGVLISLILSIYSLGLFLSYYTYCGDTFFSSDLCVLPKYKNWDPVAYHTDYLTENYLLKQSFIPHCEDVVLLRFYLSPLSAPDGILDIRLFGSNGDPLQEQTYRVSEKDPGHWLEIHLQKPIKGRGKSFYFTISPHQGSSSSHVFSLSQRREYKDGIFSINGQDVAADLLFQYGCDRSAFFIN